MLQTHSLAAQELVVVELGDLRAQGEVAVDEKRLATSLLQVRERHPRVVRLLLLELVLRQKQKDAARVRRQTAHDVHERTERKTSALADQKRVLVRSFARVEVERRDVEPQPREARALRGVPHCKQTIT